MSTNKIRTTGQLREFLATQLMGVKNGDLDPDRARNITKMAAQINESFYAEVKVARTALEMSKVAATQGNLCLGGSSEESTS